MKAAGAAARTWLLPLAVALLVAWNVGPRLWPALEAPRYYDEFFALANARVVVDGNWPRMDNAFYLATCYLPVAATWWVMQRFGDQGVADDHFGSLRALHSARLWAVFYALASLVVIERLGRTLGEGAEAGPSWLGFWAAAILAAFPRHVRSGHQIKPDIIVLFWTLAAATAAVTAARRPAFTAYLRSALAASLAFGAKATGFSAAFPIVVVALASARRHPRRLVWLIGAGVTAVAMFFLFNPYPGHLFQGLGVVSRNYRWRGGRASHGDTLLRVWDFLREGHGAVLAIAAICGLVLWIARAAGHARGRYAPAGTHANLVALALLAVPILHALVHAVSTTLFRGQNVIAIIPFTALAAACALHWTARAAAARWGRPARWTIVAAAAGLLCWLAAQPWLVAARDVGGT